MGNALFRCLLQSFLSVEQTFKRGTPNLLSTNNSCQKTCWKALGGNLDRVILPFGIQTFPKPGQPGINTCKVRKGEFPMRMSSCCKEDCDLRTKRYGREKILRAQQQSDEQPSKARERKNGLAKAIARLKDQQEQEQDQGEEEPTALRSLGLFLQCGDELFVRCSSRREGHYPKLSL